MGLYHVVLAVARAATLDTGRLIIVRVRAASRIDAAIAAEHEADGTLADQDLEFTHATNVTILDEPAKAAVAA